MQVFFKKHNTHSNKTRPFCLYLNRTGASLLLCRISGNFFHQIFTGLICVNNHFHCSGFGQSQHTYDRLCIYDPASEFYICFIFITSIICAILSPQRAVIYKIHCRIHGDVAYGKQYPAMRDNILCFI